MAAAPAMMANVTATHVDLVMVMGTSLEDMRSNAHSNTAVGHCTRAHADGLETGCRIDCSRTTKLTKVTKNGFLVIFVVLVVPRINVAKRSQASSNRSRFMTLSHAATKSRTNGSRASSHA